MVHSELTRARAYDWVGVPHITAIKAGVHWLRTDLANELENLKPGHETTLDYRGEVGDAPLLVLGRSSDDVISVRSLNGTVDAEGNTQRAWPSSKLPNRDEWIVFDLMQLLLYRRGDIRVIIPRPSG